MITEKKKIRVLIGKPGLCGHDRGALIVSMALRDAGMEVIYLGRRNTPEQMVESAIQEAVDILGVSILSGAHLTLCQQISILLKEKKVKDILFVVGGFIPEEDLIPLTNMGVNKVFGVGSSIKSIIEYIQMEVLNRTGVNKLK
ncbi:MAG: cobalamin B12-binding domain-containing protein [Promethearchaeota archaeon]|jgi:methylmalonyl-CoA mutase C-terminal domain/subunit